MDFPDKEPAAPLVRQRDSLPAVSQGRNRQSGKAPASSNGKSPFDSMNRWLIAPPLSWSSVACLLTEKDLCLNSSFSENDLVLFCFAVIGYVHSFSPISLARCGFQDLSTLISTRSRPTLCRTRECTTWCRAFPPSPFSGMNGWHHGF